MAIKQLKTVEIPGHVVVMSGMHLVLAPLNFRALKELEREIVNMGSSGPEKGEAVAKAVHASLIRNYKDVTLEDVYDILEMDNFDHVASVISGQSGLVGKVTEVKEASP